MDNLSTSNASTSEKYRILIVDDDPVLADMMLDEIHDDGKTLSAHPLETVFEPNFIGPVGGRGTGMEMSICQEIVRQHQGHIEAHSKSGKGTTFRVQSPVDKPSL